MAKATMQDIADALNTSRITVWKALNNRPGVSAALRAEIQRKAQELGYTKGGTPAAPPPHRRARAPCRWWSAGRKARCSGCRSSTAWRGS